MQLNRSLLLFYLSMCVDFCKSCSFLSIKILDFTASTCENCSELQRCYKDYFSLSYTFDLYFIIAHGQKKWHGLIKVTPLDTLSLLKNGIAFGTCTKNAPWITLSLLFDEFCANGFIAVLYLDKIQTA